MTSDPATEEYKRISEFMRTYLLLRLYRLTLLLGTSGAIVTALASENIQARGPVIILLLKVAAVGISAAFAVMDFSASGHWVRLRARANGTRGRARVSGLPRALSMESLHREGRGKLSSRPRRVTLVRQLVSTSS